MNKIRLNILILLLLTSLSAQAYLPNGKYKKTKIIEKSYSVNPGTRFKVSNVYGHINISGWNKNIIEVKVSITVSGDDAKAVNEKLREIGIETGANESEVSFTTRTPENRSSSWSLFSLLFGKKTNLGFEINYEIKVPLHSPVYIRNKYGNIFIDELQGNLDIRAYYGKLEAGELNGNRNQINLNYFSASQIDFIKNAVLKINYTTLNIDNAYRLDIRSGYSNISIEKVRKMEFDANYGSIKVYDAMLVKGEGNYQTRYFENINSLDFDGNYGSLKIVNPKNGFDRIRLRCNYSNIKILNENRVPFRLNLYQNYGCFKYDELEFIRKEEHGQQREIQAYFINPDSPSLIDIDANYGCIKIYNQF